MGQAVVKLSLGSLGGGKLQPWECSLYGRKGREKSKKQEVIKTVKIETVF